MIQEAITPRLMSRLMQNTGMAFLMGTAARLITSVSMIEMAVNASSTGLRPAKITAAMVRGVSTQPCNASEEPAQSILLLSCPSHQLIKRAVILFLFAER